MGTIFSSILVVWLCRVPKSKVTWGPIAPHPEAFFMHITESYPVVAFGRVIVLYQRGNVFHFFGAMDGDQVCVQRLAVALSFDPGQLSTNIFVAVCVKFIPEGRTGAALNLHIGVS